jgi:hypothetical protein
MTIKEAILKSLDEINAFGSINIFIPPPKVQEEVIERFDKIETNEFKMTRCINQ